MVKDTDSKQGQIRSNLMGKRCPHSDTPILMWDGQIKFAKDIIAGDIIIGDDGNKRSVKSVCSGEDEMFKIIQNKGEDYIVNSEHVLCLKFCGHKSMYCNNNGKWVLRWFDKSELKAKTKKFDTLRVAEKFKEKIDDSNIIDISIENYMKLSPSVKRLLMGFKLDKSIKWDYKEVDLDPYILGMWIGDGTSRGYGFTSADTELVEYWKKWAYANGSEIHKAKSDDIHFTIVRKDDKNANYFMKCLKKYNLIENKHIPPEYLYNDTKTRLSVLAGIIDTDGSVEQGGKTIRISQCEKNKRIIEETKFLSSSLGFQTSLNVKKTSWISNGMKKLGTAYVLNISGEGVQNIPTLLPRKKCTVSESRNATVFKIDVVPNGIGTFNGFEVDSNSRFLLGDFTVTHNCDQTGRTVIGPDPTLKMGQLAVPMEMASNLTVPVRVANFNYDYLTSLVNAGGANYVLKNEGKTRINLNYALFRKGTELIFGDEIHRRVAPLLDANSASLRSNKEVVIINVRTGKEKLMVGDRVKRGNVFLEEIKYPEKKSYKLEMGDVVERKLQNGDIVLLNPKFLS